MDNDKSKYYKRFIIRRRQIILNTDNFTNWFSDKNDGNPNKGGELRENSHYLNGENQCSYNKNDIHLKVKILQYLLQLDQALILIRKGYYGNCIKCNEEIPINHLEKLPCAQYCQRCE